MRFREAIVLALVPCAAVGLMASAGPATAADIRSIQSQMVAATQAVEASASTRGFEIRVNPGAPALKIEAWNSPAGKEKFNPGEGPALGQTLQPGSSVVWQVKTTKIAMLWLGGTDKDGKRVEAVLELNADLTGSHPSCRFTSGVACKAGSGTLGNNGLVVFAKQFPPK